MKITREQLKTIVGEVLQEEKDYKAFFNAMLKKHGVSSPADFKSDDEKKAFFNKLDSTWKGVTEKIKTWKEAKWNEAELTAKQKQLDIDGDGDIEGDDLADLRAGKKADESVNESDSKAIPDSKLNAELKGKTINDVAVRSSNGDIWLKMSNGQVYAIRGGLVGLRIVKVA
jgi:hypothetical protein